MFRICVERLLFINALIFLQAVVMGQMVPQFEADHISGCAPLKVKFTNQTSGVSAGGNYKWAFNNGNTSYLRDASAVFTVPGLYTVTLSVIDSNKTKTIQKEITVYGRPAVDFSLNNEAGCAPVDIQFKADAVASEGSISSYFWDFGDGNTLSTSEAAIQHTYLVERIPSVSLTVTDEHGCQSAILKEKVAEIAPSLSPSFLPEKPVLCRITDAAKFVNSSTGIGTLTYKWDFGDGGSSSDKTPSHVFSAKGIYDITLTVTNDKGCSATLKQENAINAANFQSKIDVQGPVCDNENTVFYNASQPAPTKSDWLFSDGIGYSTIGDAYIYRHFYNLSTYTLKLQNSFGNCIDTTSMVFEVNHGPVIHDYIIEKVDFCTAPAKVNFKDTTAGIVKWEWNSYPQTFQSNKQAPSYTFQFDQAYVIYLSVYNEAGCKATFPEKELVIANPKVEIFAKGVGPSEQVKSCGPMSFSFYARTSQPIKEFLWNFGDNFTSADSTPTHFYSKAGEYPVTLTYTTIYGCKGTVQMYSVVVIRDKFKADFTVANTTICGNTPVDFIGLTPYHEYNYYLWEFNDGTQEVSSYSGSNSFNHTFQKSGTYSIRMVVTDLVCYDTMIKKDYIKVLPPFVDITGFTNTCQDTRGDVTFTQNCREYKSGTWDFGDGTTLAFDGKPQIVHTYKKTGFYKVVLSVTNGQCTIKDEEYVPVLLKQHPILKADKNAVCSWEDPLELSFSNLQKNPAAINYYSWGYSYNQWYHADGSYAIKATPSTDNWEDSVHKQTLYSYTPGKDLYIVTTSDFFGCVDTTNIIPLAVKGPVAGFKQIIKDPCAGTATAILQDTSRSSSPAPLVKWEWDMGDGNFITQTKPEQLIYTYKHEGVHLVNVKVTDADGCSESAYGYSILYSAGLTAEFVASSFKVSPGTRVYFTNTSQSIDPVSTQYTWLLPDGTKPTGDEASQLFNTPGKYTVRLTAVNTVTGCRDTVSHIVEVKKVNAAFTFNSGFISNSKCLPVLVSFSNTSANVVNISWDFGDGTIVNDIFNPTHVYTKAGHYTIKVITKSDNGTTYTTEDSLYIPGLAANIRADKLHGCTAQNITLSSVATNAVSYAWDYGDGIVQQSNDVSVAHNFSRAGIYLPKLVVKNEDGCAFAAALADTIIIDSLALSLQNIPASVCIPKEVNFHPVAESIAGNQAQEQLSFHWNFGTGQPRDTSNIKEPSFNYNKAGNYALSLRVVSPYGCVKEISKNIQAAQGLGAKIVGPLELCPGTDALFKATTLLNGQATWGWDFGNGNKSNEQNPPVQHYNNSGVYPVLLLVNNGACLDTIAQSLTIFPNSKPALSTHNTFTCEGKSVSLEASGGILYAWSPASGLNTVNNAAIEATPITNTTYTVAVTDEHHCTSRDSVVVEVVHPFKLQAQQDYTICEGSSVQLSASGTDNYTWIGNTTGLNNINTASPVAAPSQTTTYTVLAADSKKCFSDTANVLVRVDLKPKADAGPDTVLLAGSNYRMMPVYGSDVISYTWVPGKYLDCSDCPEPMVKPQQNMTYTLTVANAAGCINTDTVAIKIFCTNSRLFIPTAFTPNGDGLNDVFSILGQGISNVKSFKIYNEWGQLIFNHSNFVVGDRTGSWDGKFKGVKVPQGSYVYIAEVSCFENTFVQKGSVTVLY